MTASVAHEEEDFLEHPKVQSHQLHVQDEMEYLDLLEVMNEHYEQLEVQKHEHMRDKHSKQRTARTGQGGEIGTSFDRDHQPSASTPTGKLFQSTESWRFASLLDSSISSDNSSSGTSNNVLQSILDEEETGSAVSGSSSVESIIENNVFKNIRLEPTTRKTVPIEVTMPPKIHNMGLEVNDEEVSKANDDHHQPESQNPNPPVPSPSLSKQSNATDGRDEKEHIESDDIEHDLEVTLDPNKQSVFDISPGDKDSTLFFQRSNTAERKTKDTQFLARGRSMVDPEIRSNVKKTDGYQRKRILVTKTSDEGEAIQKTAPPSNHVDTPHQLPLSIPLKIYERQEVNLEGNQLSNSQISTSENVIESIDDHYSKPLAATTRQKAVPQKVLFTNRIDNRPAEQDQVRHDKAENVQQSVNVSLKKTPEIAIRARLVIDGREEQLKVAEEHSSQHLHRSKEKPRQIAMNDEPRKKSLPATVVISKSSPSSALKNSTVRRKAPKAIRQRSAEKVKRTKPRREESDSESTTSTQSSVSTHRFTDNNSLALLDELEQYQTNLQAATKKARGAIQMQFDNVQGLADRAMQRLTNFADLDRHIRIQMDENVSKAQMLSDTILKAEHDAVSKIQEFKQRAMDNRTNQTILRTFGSLKEPNDGYGHFLKPPTWINDGDAEISTDDQKKIMDELEECRDVILELAGQFDSKTFTEDSEALMRQKEKIFLELGSSMDRTPHSLVGEFETMWQCVMNAPVSLPPETNEEYQSEQADTEAIHWELQHPEFESFENAIPYEHSELVEGILEFSVLHKARKMESVVAPVKNENKEDLRDFINSEQLDITEICEETAFHIAAEESEVLPSTYTRDDVNIQHETVQQVHGVAVDIPPTTSLVIHDIDSKSGKTSDVSDGLDQRVNEEGQQDQRSSSSTKKEERFTSSESECVDSKWVTQRENDILMQELQQQIEYNRMEAESSSPPPPSVKRDLISMRTGMHELKSEVKDEEECITDCATESGVLYKNNNLPRRIHDDTHTTLQPRLFDTCEMRNNDEDLIQKELLRMSEQAVEAVSHEILHRIISERNAINVDTTTTPEEKKSEPIFTQIHLFSPDLIQFCIDNGIALDGPELKATVTDVLNDIITHSSIGEGRRDCSHEDEAPQIGERNVDPLKDIDPLDSITESIYNLLQKLILRGMMDSISEQSQHDLELGQDSSPESEVCENIDDTNEVEKAPAQEEDKHTTVVAESLENKMSSVQDDGEKEEKKKGYFESIFSDLGDRGGALFELLDNVISRTVERNAPSQKNRELSQHIVSEISHRPPGVNMEIQTSTTYLFSGPQSQSTQTQAGVKKTEETQVQTSKTDQADVLVQTDKFYEPSVSECDRSEVTQSEPSSPSSPASSLFINHQIGIQRQMLRKEKFSLGPSDAERRLRRALYQYSKRNPHISMDLGGSDSSNHTVQTFDTCSSGSSHTISSVPLFSFNDSDLDVQIRELWLRAKEQHGSIWTSSSSVSTEGSHVSSETGKNCLDNGFSTDTTTYEDSDGTGYSDDEEEEEEEEINLTSSLLLYDESENSCCGDEDLDSFATGSSLDHSFHDMRFESDREQSANLIHQDLGNVIARLLREDLATVDMDNLYDDMIGSSSTE